MRAAARRAARIFVRSGACHGTESAALVGDGSHDRGGCHAALDERVDDVAPEVSGGTGDRDHFCTFTASASIDSLISLATRTPPASSAWFHVRPKSRRSILPLALK